MATWNSIPREIQQMVLDALVALKKKEAQKLLHTKPRLSQYVTVCRFWQEALEPVMFRDLHIKPKHLADFDNYLRGARRLMLRHLWFRVQLSKPRRRMTERDKMDEEEDNNAFFTTAVYDLFATLRKWGRLPQQPLELELGAESPGDPKWSFGDQGIMTNNDYSVGELDFCFVDGFKKFSYPSPLPEVGVVTTFSILRRTRRYFAPQALLTIFDSLPNVCEIRYEPWYFLNADSQCDVDEAFGRYIRHWPSTVKRISIYEHCREFRRHFPNQFIEFDDAWMDENGGLFGDLDGEGDLHGIDQDHDLMHNLHHHHHHHHVHHHHHHDHHHHHHVHHGDGQNWHGPDNESVADEDGWETANEDDDGFDDDDDFGNNQDSQNGTGDSNENANNGWNLPSAPDLVQAFANALSNLPLPGSAANDPSQPIVAQGGNGAFGDPGGGDEFGGGDPGDYPELAPLGLGLLFIRPSQKLQELAVSGLIDARDFFEPFYARPESGMSEALPSWDELRWLTLTSPALLNPSPCEGGSEHVNELLQAAGRAAMRMPKLQVMELYSTDARGGAVFRYQATQTRTAISWSSAWSSSWRPPNANDGGTATVGNNFDNNNGGNISLSGMLEDADGDVDMGVVGETVDVDDDEHPSHFRVSSRVIETWQRVARRLTRHDLDPVFESVSTWPGDPFDFLHENLVTRELVLHEASSMDILQTFELPGEALKLPRNSMDSPLTLRIQRIPPKKESGFTSPAPKSHVCWKIGRAAPSIISVILRQAPGSTNTRPGHSLWPNVIVLAARLQCSTSGSWDLPQKNSSGYEGLDRIMGGAYWHSSAVNFCAAVTEADSKRNLNNHS
ncbi:uncharacterized protein PpBr36_10004 [Pyricularia pennisetigena]|uniref:uncharacterized protein n=1 Tax=Pyricularia pennisetigena TaxID=1578925 RepID=UPI001150F657|nr:uncharacterized protein PpBr36_10004 [Pyricularia pennisetigena]TLS22413.1 hypothetical protein PpBr36_10004 [Pyricularia pennisetigena]